MIIILLNIKVIQIFACAQFNKEQEISLYPTAEGEFYEYHMENLLSETQLTCKMQPQIPNVQLINQCEEICRKKGNQFISMSSNKTHFGTLSKNNEVIIYKWKYQRFICDNQSFVQLFQYQFVFKLSTQFRQIAIITMNSYQFKQYIHNQNLLFQYDQIYLLQLKYDQLQKEQILLLYMPYIFRIIQQLYFYHHHFLIQIAQINNLLILISQLQQVQKFLQLLPKIYFIILISRLLIQFLIQLQLSWLDQF
ncbi:unnamed protein product [Paramecium pentaurelia]|uniref:Transmembrane protein n=1 Tax=Paramecium pentaurelia TaxID=43138 RepID=A0A8S1SQI6_9CILI|nr:unnamed protein product [Paramecium pentaurelia]